MRRGNRANLRKTLYYLKRNGLRATWYAVKERLEQSNRQPYDYKEPSAQMLESQRKSELTFSGKISIVVPAYRTGEDYLRDLVDSLMRQTYSQWELILADATEDDSVERVMSGYHDQRICYVRLEGNNGIAENTNRALQYVTGSYTGLLDHDDVLTPDALYEMAAAIGRAQDAGQSPDFVYSDEDKCNGDRSRYYEPHHKEDFNLDLLLSNNYICHFLVMKSDLIKALKFRREYDGAQDYDLVLRAVLGRLTENCPDAFFFHVPKILYHWRCHEGSTAGNPQSKEYAYTAGRRAVQDFVNAAGWNAYVSELKHKGFYRVDYETSVFASRRDVGAVGGRVISRGKLVGGRYDAGGEVYYQGTPVQYSGYMHRMVLQQDAQAVDLRCIRLSETCFELFEKVVGVPYRMENDTGIFDVAILPGQADITALSIALGKALREAGYRLLWDPELSVTI